MLTTPKETCFSLCLHEWNPLSSGAFAKKKVKVQFNNLLFAPSNTHNRFNGLTLVDASLVEERISGPLLFFGREGALKAFFAY